MRQGRSATAALAAVDARLRPGVQSLVFHVLRHLGCAEALRNQLASKKPAPAADVLLCVSLALCCGESPPYDSFVLCDQSVEAAKRNPATKHQAGFINACLRRYLREASALQGTVAGDVVARWNHPRWWIDRLKREYPQHWQQILLANNCHPPLTLRVNAAQGTVADYQSRLSLQGIPSQRTGEFGLDLAVARPVQSLPGFEQGAVSVQDAAAQRAAPLLLKGLTAPVPGTPWRVLDACAAPGGKTAHLLEYATGVLKQAIEITALEVDAVRAERIRQTVSRLGAAESAVKVRVGDAGDPTQWWDQQPFDAILLDAPCTASGIVRRHPDVRWLRKAADIEQLAAVQARLLRTLWPLLKVGGRMLYCTCSVFHAEGESQIQPFLAHNTDSQLLPSPGHLIPQGRHTEAATQDNASLDEDGFFYALFEKVRA